MLPLGWITTYLQAVTRLPSRSIDRIHRSQRRICFLVFYWSKSGWSNTQTVTIPASSNSALPSSTSITTHAVPEFPLMATPLLLSLLSVAGILGLRKKRRGKH